MLQTALSQRCMSQNMHYEDYEQTNNLDNMIMSFQNTGNYNYNEIKEELEDDLVNHSAQYIQNATNLTAAHENYIQERISQDSNKINLPFSGCQTERCMNLLKNMSEESRQYCSTTKTSHNVV